MIEDRRPLLLVLLVLLALLAVALPVGLLTWARTSGADFAESEDVGVNRLGSATLDVEVGPSRAALGARNMAPGDVATGGIELRNAGSLALRYAVTAEVVESPLLDWLRWNIWAQPGVCAAEEPSFVLRRDAVFTPPIATVIGDPATGADPDDRVLVPGQRESLCFAARLPIDAPNVVQGREIVIDFLVDAEHDIEPSPAADAGADS